MKDEIAWDWGADILRNEIKAVRRKNIFNTYTNKVTAIITCTGYRQEPFYKTRERRIEILNTKL